MAFKFNRSSKEPMSEINVTPFVDVMLVLLIIFMVTAPLLTVGVQVDLPESSADSLPEETEPLTLSINAKGEIFIQEAKVEYDNIIAKVLAVSKNRTDTRIYVRGDKTINYGRVLEIMGLLSGSGFAYISSLLQVLKIETSNTSEKAFNAFNDSVMDWSGILNFSRTSTGAVR